MPIDDHGGEPYRPDECATDHAHLVRVRVRVRARARARARVRARARARARVRVRVRVRVGVRTAAAPAARLEDETLDLVAQLAQLRLGFVSLHHARLVSVAIVSRAMVP